MKFGLLEFKTLSSMADDDKTRAIYANILQTWDLLVFGLSTFLEIHNRSLVARQLGFEQLVSFPWVYTENNPWHSRRSLRKEEITSFVKKSKDLAKKFFFQCFTHCSCTSAKFQDWWDEYMAARNDIDSMVESLKTLCPTFLSNNAPDTK